MMLWSVNFSGRLFPVTRVGTAVQIKVENDGNRKRIGRPGVLWEGVLQPWKVEGEGQGVCTLSTDVLLLFSIATLLADESPIKVEVPTILSLCSIQNPRCPCDEAVDECFRLPRTLSLEELDHDLCSHSFTPHQIQLVTTLVALWILI